MALPTNDEYVETIFRLQKFIAVSGHCQQLGIERDTEAYRFDIKMPDLDMPDGLRDKFLTECFNEAVSEAKKIWPWIADIKRAGKNKGWAIVLKKEQAGIHEWNDDYRGLVKANGDKDVMQIYWMLIDKRANDLAAMSEFVADMKRTFERRAPAWLLANDPKTAKPTIEPGQFEPNP